MSFQDRTDQPHISLAYLPPTPRQTWLTVAWVVILLLGLAVVAPFADKQLPYFYSFIPAIDAIIFVTDLITAGLLLAHFSATRSRALWALAGGYLFSAAMVVAHGLSFPEPVHAPGYLNQSNHSNFRIYLLWHFGLPTAVFAYAWLRNRDPAKADANTPTALMNICGVAAVFALAGCIAWLAIAGNAFLPSALTSTNTLTARSLTTLTMLVCVAALCVLWFSRRSILDQWLMIALLASIVELAITALFGGLKSHVTYGFYTGRVLALVTSTVVLTFLLGETTRLYARLAHANMLAGIVKASHALSSEIEFPKLIERLMTIALENAGADHGLLILPAGNEYLIQAEARATGHQFEVAMRQEPITQTACSESLVRHVIRKQETTILDDTTKPNPFSGDCYLRNRQSKSILCLPLIEQRGLVGVLFLENSLTSHAFSPARIAVLELLAAQAAISLENTHLYSDLQERESKIRRLVEANIIGILFVDIRGYIIEANDAFLRIVRYERKDLVSGRMCWTDLTPPEWRAADAKRVEEIKLTGTLQPFEKEYFRKDGSRVPVLIGVARFDGSPTEAVAFVLDLSETKRAESELRQARSDLAHVARVTALGELAASIAHEVNQPLAAVVTNANACLRWLDRADPNFDEAREAVQRIVRDGNRGSEVIGRIRALLKKGPAQKTRVSVNEAVQEILKLAKTELRGTILEIRLANELTNVIADRVQLQQVLLNLMINAIDAMKTVSDRPHVLRIETKLCGDDVLVAVQDSGVGLQPNGEEKLFETFYTTKPEGLGLGLSISRSIIEEHGGRLWAECNQGPGATFRFTLPVQKGDSA